MLNHILKKRRGMRRTIRTVEEKKKEKKKEKDRMEEYEKRKQWKICRYKKVEEEEE